MMIFSGGTLSESKAILRTDSRMLSLRGDLFVIVFLLLLLPSFVLALDLRIEITESGVDKVTGVTFSIKSKELENDIIEYEIEMSGKEDSYYNPEFVFPFDSEIVTGELEGITNPVSIKISKSQFKHTSVFKIPRSKIHDRVWLYDEGKDKMDGFIFVIELSKFTPEAIAEASKE